MMAMGEHGRDKRSDKQGGGRDKQGEEVDRGVADTYEDLKRGEGLR